MTERAYIKLTISYPIGEGESLESALGRFINHIKDTNFSIEKLETDKSNFPIRSGVK